LAQIIGQPRSEAESKSQTEESGQRAIGCPSYLLVFNNIFRACPSRDFGAGGRVLANDVEDAWAYRGATSVSQNRQLFKEIKNLF
jgi:hypothetical protein